MVLEPEGKKDFLKFDRHCGNGPVGERGLYVGVSSPLPENLTGSDQSDMKT